MSITPSRATPLTLSMLAVIFAALLVLSVAMPAAAQDSVVSVRSESQGTMYRVTITNLTRAQVFSPPLVVSHSRRIALFELGAAPSDELAALAEDGMTAPLAGLVEGLSDVSGVAAAGAPVLPGGSISIEVPGKGYHRLSVVSMLVNTNDAFLALDSGVVPRHRYQRSSYLVPAFDAGSEANNEECGFIPGPACGGAGAGVRAPQGAEGYVYVSNGVQGIADLASAIYDWHNPVAKVTIQRIR
jgi:hypothetical protein